MVRTRAHEGPVVVNPGPDAHTGARDYLREHRVRRWCIPRGAAGEPGPVAPPNTAPSVRGR